MALKIDYVEIRTPDIVASQRFLATAFDWTFRDYGPTYQAFDNAGLDGGLDGDDPRGESRSLVILKTDDLEAALSRVEAAGGQVLGSIFSFPGGRRFHFREPGGCEMAVWSEA